MALTNVGDKEYQVYHGSNCFEIYLVERVTHDQRHYLAGATTEADAKLIAKALNEMEGL